MPKATIGTPVCCPSTVEVTSRLAKLVRYTTFCPPDRTPLRINPENEIEVKSLLEKYNFQANTEGTSFLDPATQSERKQGVLSGDYLGEIVALEFSTKEGLLHSYDEKLQALGLPYFSSPKSLKTRSDWAILSCDNDRYAYSNQYLPLIFQDY